MATTEHVFAELADRFRLEDKVRDQILASGVATLSEFRFLTQDDAELLAAFYTPIESQLTNKPLQKPLLRQAWAAVCQAEKTREDRGSHLTVSLEEEEEVLPSNRSPKAQKSLALDLVCGTSALCSTSGRLARPASVSKVGDNLYYNETADEDDQDVDNNWYNYVAQLRLYIFALAMVGTGSVEPAPVGKETPQRGVDFVQIPLDVVLKYLYRVERLVRELPDKIRFVHIANVDQAERAEWAQRFSAGSDTVGRVIQLVYKQRDSHWVVPAVPSSPYAPAEEAA